MGTTGRLHGYWGFEFRSSHLLASVFPMKAETSQWGHGLLSPSGSHQTTPQIPQELCRTDLSLLALSLCSSYLRERKTHAGSQTRTRLPEPRSCQGHGEKGRAGARDCGLSFSVGTTEIRFNVSTPVSVCSTRGGRRGHRAPQDCTPHACSTPNWSHAGVVSPLWMLGTHWALCRGSRCANH